MGFLQKAVNRALDDRVNNITLVDLLKEIETLAMVRQSNIANTLALITAKQERDEPIPQFAAHLQPWCSVQPDNHNIKSKYK